MNAVDPFVARDTTPFLSSSLLNNTDVDLLNMPRDTVKGVTAGVARPAETEMVRRKASDLRVVTTKLVPWTRQSLSRHAKLNGLTFSFHSLSTSSSCSKSRMASWYRSVLPSPKLIFSHTRISPSGVTSMTPGSEPEPVKKSPRTGSADFE